ncbi:hypothetical protein F4859DRAFT_510270 [Xylaria cf. heliscus]|nr:hypothetical protein F4859DRAFT_510270 [Xylaria cf. heliscus]
MPQPEKKSDDTQNLQSSLAINRDPHIGALISSLTPVTQAMAALYSSAARAPIVVITILHGFNVNYAVLEAFLMSNSLAETFGLPSFKGEYGSISRLVRTKMDGTCVGKGVRVKGEIK